MIDLDEIERRHAISGPTDLHLLIAEVRRLRVVAPQQEPPTNSAAPADGEPFVDTPLKAAIRKAFDYPTVANIEAVARAAAVDPPPDKEPR